MGRQSRIFTHPHLRTPAMLYPRPGTMAERVLWYIRQNPGCSANSVIKGLGLNPSPARLCIANLVDRKIVADEKTPDGVHAFTAIRDKKDDL